MMHNSQATVYFLDSSIFQKPEIFSRYYKQIPENRKEKIASYSLQKDKRLSLAAAVLLKLALEKNGIEEKEQIIEISESGKPFLSGSDKIFFNLSHSGNLACCVISSDVNGIDLESVKTSRIKMAERFFPKEDIDYIFDSASDDDKALRFYECWTAKEAFCKMCEKALDKVLQIPLSEIKENVFCMTKTINNDYVCSVCTKDKSDIIFEEIKIQ